MVLNPDHLPLILGIEKGWFKEEALEIEMIEPEKLRCIGRNRK